MDGIRFNLNGMNGQNSFEQIKSSTTSPNSPLKNNSANAPGADFSATLKDAIQSVDQLQKTADVKMQELVTGKSQNIHETMIAAEKAEIALKLMIQVRNKIMDAYQEIMRMQL